MCVNRPLLLPSAHVRSPCGSISRMVQPNQQLTLNKLLTELQCRNFVNKHRLSMYSVLLSNCDEFFAHFDWVTLSHMKLFETKILIDPSGIDSA